MAGQVQAASDNVLAVMLALMWMSEAWVEVEGAFRLLFLDHHAEWLAVIKASKDASISELIASKNAIITTMRIMGFEPSAEMLALETKATALAEAELRRRGFFDESTPLELD
ncbi:hypothetical protein [Mesorhizobium sp. M0323]|uniref:hypothetical protein n=1 Tax=Mesorhizobium sp. M0323 TaxID=2956938 RepID=UPI00333943F7